MGFRFRFGKHKNKLIALLLFLSIFVQQFVCPALIRATELDNGFYATYWDLFNSIASEMGYSMSEIKEDHNVSRPDVMDRANVNFLKFMDWLGQTPSINHSGGGHDIEDDSSGDHSGGGTSIREDTEVYIEEAKNLMHNATTKGIKMSQGLWDAFRQYFDDVANEKPIYYTYTSHTIDDLVDYVHTVTNIDESRLRPVFSMYNIVHDNICIVYVGGEYHIYSPYHSNSGVWHWVDANDGWDRSKLCFTDNFNETFNGVVFYTDPSLITHNSYGFYRASSGAAKKSNTDNSARIVATNWSYIEDTVDSKYSPFIDYKPTDSCPEQMPTIIPWSTFPDHEVTEDDTKIYIPIDSTNNPTETPEEPTETPENPDDGDDITNLVPIFPDIDIDPDIHLPDDWINPPDIDLDPDVDVDTPSPGGKIPHLQKLKEKFPFCIPFDLVLLFKMLNKKPKAPKWEFKHDFQIGDSKPYTWEVVVDMSDYDKYVQIFREGFFLLFLVGLFFVTKKLISWQTG